MPTRELTPSLSAPGRQHAHAGQAERETWQWLDSHDIARSTHHRDNLRRTQVGYCIGLYYPDAADLETLTLLCRFAAWAELIDEELDAGPANREPQLCLGAVTDLLRAFDDPADQPGRQAMARATAQLWHDVAFGRAADWATRFRTDVTAYLWSHYTNTLDHAAGRMPHLDEYRERRRENIAAQWFLQLCEVAVGVDLPDAVHHVPAFRAMHTAAADATALDNDRFSAARERATGVQDNAVFVLEHHQHLSPEQSMARVNEMIAANDERMATNYRELPRQLELSGLPAHTVADAVRCADAYVDYTRGHRWYCATTLRYKPESVPSGTTHVEGFAAGRL